MTRRIGVWLAALALAAWAGGAQAAVERIEVLAESAFAGGAAFGAVGSYRKITGRLHYVIDPAEAANARIADIAYAARDADGMVRFAGDFMLLMPADATAGNRRLLYEVGNRGSIGMLTFFNDAPPTNDPASAADAGSGFLLEQGYALLWSAWNWDVRPGEGRAQITLPAALGDDGAPVTGLVSAEITVNEPTLSQPVAWGNARGYPALDLDQADARLTKRAHQNDPRREIPRANWRFAREERGRLVPDAASVAVDGGFEPGLLYEVVYRAGPAVVVGLGLAAIRDSLSYFRYAAAPANPLAGVLDHVIAFGISQSGRVINQMLLDGLHVDERGRGAFDAALVHVAGAGKGSFNHRFAQTTRHPSTHQDHQYPADFFPFATVASGDPVTGETGDLLAGARGSGVVPKIFFTNTSGEYWTRAASLLHTDVTGSRDLGLAESARLYVFASGQHGSWLLDNRLWVENCINPLDYRPAMRALLLRLDAWASEGRAPPASVYPRITEGTLGTVADYRAKFPAIPGLRLPLVNLRPPRLELGPRWSAQRIIDRVPPGFGPAYETRVPMPDGDGIDLGGIRLPEVAAPLGTFTGWNLRREGFGATDMIGRWFGSFIPFAADEAARAQAGDPRPSRAARYQSRADYVAGVGAAAEALAGEGFLRAAEVPQIAARLGAFYDRLHARAPRPGACAYIVPRS